MPAPRYVAVARQLLGGGQDASGGDADLPRAGATIPEVHGVERTEHGVGEGSRLARADVENLRRLGGRGVERLERIEQEPSRDVSCSSARTVNRT